LALAGNQAAIARSAEGRRSHNSIDPNRTGDRTIELTRIEQAIPVGATRLHYLTTPIHLIGSGRPWLKPLHPIQLTEMVLTCDRMIQLTGRKQAIAQLN